MLSNKSNNNCRSIKVNAIKCNGIGLPSWRFYWELCTIYTPNCIMNSKIALLHHY